MDLGLNALIIAADNDLLSSALYFADHFEKTPLVKDKEYINSVLEICKRLKVSIIIPTIDLELPLFAKIRKRLLKQNIDVLISEFDTIISCDDKLKTHKLFTSLEIPVPMLYSSPSLVDKFPVYIKPKTGSGTKGHFIAHNADMLNGIIKSVDIDSFIITEFIDGREYTIDVLCDHQNNMIAHCIRMRIETRGGVMDKGMTVYNDAITGHIEKVFRKLRTYGPANIQCIEKDKNFYFIEINPRFSGGFPLSVIAGLNIPLLVLKLITKQKISPKELIYKDNIKAASYSEMLPIP